MGLEPDESPRRNGPGARHNTWLLPMGLATFAIGAEVAGEAARVALRYSQPAIADGELWRLLTGHLVHLGWSHAVMNLLALFAIWLLVGRSLRPAEWLLAILLIVAGIDIGFLWLEPQLTWYVGLSGILHGLLATGLLASWNARRGEVVVLGSLLVAKLIYEQVAGPLPGSAATAGGAVVVDAHLYGALSGMGAWVALRVRLMAARPI